MTLAATNGSNTAAAAAAMSAMAAMSLPMTSSSISMSYEYLQAAHAQQQALLWASMMCPSSLLPINVANAASAWSLPFGNGANTTAASLSSSISTTCTSSTNSI
jgi:hypothetical protein